MINSNPIKNQLSKKGGKVSDHVPSKLLADFFNGVIIKLDQEYNHES
tara:strand:- start:334 stop:474 length:141 start_codon:yes stop_codon:yes gene_type:complete